MAQDATQIEVSLTSFADFVLKSGLPKFTAAQQIRRQYEEGYNPAFDYYKKFRDGVRRLHEQSLGIAALDGIVGEVAEPNKIVNYELLARGYTRFWNTNLQEHGSVWLPPPRTDWSYGNVRVRVSPELAFADGQTVHLFKMHLKDEPLVKPQVQVILHLMQLAIRRVVHKPAISILDVRRGRQFEATTFNPKWTVVLEAEALAFERMYQQAESVAEMAD